MLSNSIKALCFLGSLQLFATDLYSDSITKQRIDAFVGTYQVVEVEIYKNEIKVSEAEALADVNATSSLGLEALSLVGRSGETYSLELTLEGGEKTNWKMLEGNHTSGDEAVGIDGHTLRLGTFENSQVGWRKINFETIGKITQSRVVETLSFEEKEGTLLFSQHKVYYEYPIGTPNKVPRKLTQEFVYKLKKL